LGKDSVPPEAHERLKPPHELGHGPLTSSSDMVLRASLADSNVKTRKLIFRVLQFEVKKMLK
jgi:hypothetical protein